MLQDILPKISGARCLVTGGAGGIGSQLVAQLVALGGKVVVLDNLSSGYLDNLEALASTIEFVQGDVSCRADLQRTFSPAPDYVFHLAAHFANQNSVEHPYEDMMSNAVGTQMVLDEALRCSESLRGLVYASSSCVLGQQTGLSDEESPLRPETPYAISKLAGEQYTLFYARTLRLRASVVRYFNVFGPGERPGQYRGVVPNFIDRALRGLPLRITGNGTEMREFIHVADAVRATVLAATTPEALGDVFHVGSGNCVTIRELAERVIEITGSSSHIEFAPRRNWDSVLERRTSHEKAMRVLGYVPQVGFEEGLRSAYKWVQALNTAERSAAAHE